ncbi:hypothetical protein Tco_0676121 [Tanacetum coccineum]
MVFMSKMEKVLSDLDESSLSVNDTIEELPYFSSDSKSKYNDVDTSDYYDKSELTYGLYADNNYDQEMFHDASEPAHENFDETHVVYENDHNESECNHKESKEKYHIVDTMLLKFTYKIAKSKKRIEKANQQNKELIF